MTDFGPWTLEPLGDGDGPPLPASIAATVPGCVHLDLLAAGLIDEPYLADNAAACAWVSGRDWRYRTTFHAESAGERVKIAAESLQGTATVSVNGAAIATHASQHRPLNAALSAAVVAGENVLTIDFRSPPSEAASLAAERGEYPVAMPGVEPSVHLRQMACAFGWDWAPSLATVGVVGPVALRPAGVPRFTHLRCEVAELADARARLSVAADAAHLGPAGEVTLAFELSDPSGAVVAAGPGAAAPGESFTTELEVPRPRRWWPRGYGDQPLYTLRARLERGGTVVAERSRRVGLRTVALDRAPDAAGSAFTIVVNGRPVFAKGMNWIPVDQLLPRVTPERIIARIADATEAGANLLRVWGGGVFEPDAFYDACDERGVLVWQDFPFACGMYPDAALAEEAGLEARHQVARLSSHACLALFCGGNENVWFHQIRPAWREAVGATGWGDRLYYGVLPRVVSEVAPRTPYVANSPFGAGEGEPVDAPGHGPQHLWDAWNRAPAEAYRRSVPRFASEFGFCGPAHYATLDEAVGLAGRSPHDPLVAGRMKAVNGQQKLFDRLGEVFDDPRSLDLDGWLCAGQLMQAWAVRTGVDWFRAHWPTCAGAVVWQLHDCWPAVSWSLVDSGGRRKLAWFAAREAMADRRITFQPRGGEDGSGVHVVAVNDADAPMSRRESLRRHDLAGRTVAECELRIDVPPRSARWIAVPDLLAAPAGAGPGDTFLRCAGATWFDAPHKAIDYPAPRVDVGCSAHADGYDVRVTAGSFVRDLCLFPDRLDPAAAVDSALVTLLPGESHTFHVATARTLSQRDLARWPVLATANDLAARDAAGAAAHRAG